MAKDEFKFSIVQFKSCTIPNIIEAYYGSYLAKYVSPDTFALNLELVTKDLSTPGTELFSFYSFVKSKSPFLFPDLDQSSLSTDLNSALSIMLKTILFGPEDALGLTMKDGLLFMHQESPYEEPEGLVNPMTLHWRDASTSLYCTHQAVGGHSMIDAVLKLSETH